MATATTTNTNSIYHILITGGSDGTTTAFDATYYVDVRSWTVTQVCHMTTNFMIRIMILRCPVHDQRFLSFRRAR